MRQGSRRLTLQLIVAALALAGRLCCSVHACTVLELSSSTGFAANVLRIFHTLPIFEGFNGTFFVDEGDFRFKCKQARLPCPPQACSLCDLRRRAGRDSSLPQKRVLPISYAESVLRQNGGLQDFLDIGDHIQAWTPEAEAQADGAPCSRFDLLQADSIAADIDVGWGELATMSSRRVRTRLLFCLHFCARPGIRALAGMAAACGTALSSCQQHLERPGHAGALKAALCCRSGSCSPGWRRRLKRW